MDNTRIGICADEAPYTVSPSPQNSGGRQEAIEVKILDPRLTEKSLDYATAGSAGLDLRAAIPKTLVLMPGDRASFSSGVALHIKNPALCGFIYPRSSTGRQDLMLENTGGVIDSDFTGEIKLFVRNSGSAPLYIEPMERVAQIVISRIEQVHLHFVQQLAQTERGCGGFGSTGRQ